MRPGTVHKLAAWATIALIGGVLTPFTLNLLASKSRSQGFRRFVAFTYLGGADSLAGTS